VIVTAAVVTVTYLVFAPIGQALRAGGFPQPNLAPIEVEAAKDLGAMPRAATVTLVFTIRNRTEAPIRLLGAKTSCSCATVGTCRPGSTDRARKRSGCRSPRRTAPVRSSVNARSSPTTPDNASSP